MNKLSINSFLSSKKNLIFLSAVIAVIFWFCITIIENPASQRIVTGVPIYFDTSNTVVEQQGLSPIDFNAKDYAVNVKISGPSKFVNGLMPSDIKVTPSLDGVNASGKHTLKLNVTNSNNNIKIESISPETINVEFDYIDTLTYQVQIKVKNAVAEDGLVLGPERFTNSETAYLKISGPRSKVSKIASVFAVASADKNKKLTATHSFDAKIELRDDKDKKISTDGLTLEYDTVSVSVPVYKTKIVPIKCVYINKPANYKPKVKLTSSGKIIEKIKIEGAPDIIDKTDYVELEAIDFKDVYDNPKMKKKFALPSGIFIVDDIEKINVSINTSALGTKSFEISRIVPLNNSKNYSVKLGNKIKVKICGKKSVLKKLKASNLFAQVDLDGKAVGEQTLPIVVKSSKDNIWQIGDYSVKIIISK